MHITRVGLGTWAFGGERWAMGWGPQDDGDTLAAIRHAVERGINWIDTAAAYGLGHAETLVGQALARMPASERPYVFTKGGLACTPGDPSGRLRRVGNPDSLRREVEASLRRLGVERIDLFQMHWPAGDGTPLEVYWAALQDLKQAGKLRAIGLSNHNLAQLQAAERVAPVDVLQPPFSAIRREAAEHLLPWCAGHEVGVIVYSPMHSGLLSGAFSAERAGALPASDWRSRHPDFTPPELVRNLALAEAFGPIAQRHGTTPGAAAVAWTLAWPGVTGAIAGARNARQVDGWIAAATLELDDEDMAEVALAIEASGAGAGPLRPEGDAATLAGHILG
ncbi:aldo/keto reductase [Bordetella sp. 2513F-2]